MGTNREIEELTRDYNLLIMENSKLRARIRQQERVILQLRQTLARFDVDSVAKIETEGYKSPNRGRPPKIDTETRDRIRKLKERGLSVREIAKKEGVSIGTVSGC